ncbi:MAG: hypothetical protein KDB69_05570, partial [Acidimicrobiia bacterium]|nr:hypothetical protein [Acidimicrobiia bacterium]
PHPAQGGTMRAPIIGAVAGQLVAAGFTSVRFNFRGVGESTGTHDGGIAEVSDVAAVVGFAEDTGSVRGITGWSFGGAVSLIWQAQTASDLTYVGIAPPVASPLTPGLPDADALAVARRLFIVGERDQFVDAPDLVAYAHRIGAEVEVYAGSDHFFVFKHDRLAADVVGFLADERVDQA